MSYNTSLNIPSTKHEFQQGVQQIIDLVTRQVSASFDQETIERNPNAITTLVGEVDSNVVTTILKLGDASVYMTLSAMEVFKEAADQDAYRTNLLKSRSCYCEALSIILVQSFTDKVHLFQNVLGYKYPDLNDDGYCTALEQAISNEALSFLVIPAVEDCIDSIDHGNLLLEEGNFMPIYRSTLPSREQGWSGLFVEARRTMRTPLHHRLISILVFVIFLTLYTIVVNSRPKGADRLVNVDLIVEGEWSKPKRHHLPTNHISGVEVCMYTILFSYVIDELRQIKDEGFSFYILSLWNWLDLAWLGTFLTSFVCRIIAVQQDSSTKHGLTRQAEFNDFTWDSLALAAVFLWARMLSVFDNNQYFGTSILIMSSMLRDALLFIVILVPLLIGVCQAMIALRPSIPWTQTVFFIGTSLLGNINFDGAKEYDPFWGPLLYVIWIVVGVLVLLNLLIAIFNSSYGNVISRAYHEYRFLRSVEILESWRNPDAYPFPPPTNLVDLILVQPLKLFKVPGWQTWERFLWNLVTLPFQVIIALWQSFMNFGNDRPRIPKRCIEIHGMSWYDDAVAMTAQQANQASDEAEETHESSLKSRLMEVVERIIPESSRETKEKLLNDLLEVFPS